MGCGSSTHNSNDKTAPTSTHDSNQFKSESVSDNNNLNSASSESYYHDPKIVRDNFDENGRFQQGSGYTKPSENIPGTYSLDLEAAFGCGYNTGPGGPGGHATYHPRGEKIQNQKSPRTVSKTKSENLGSSISNSMNSSANYSYTGAGPGGLNYNKQSNKGLGMTSDNLNSLRSTSGQDHLNHWSLTSDGKNQNVARTKSSKAALSPRAPLSPRADNHHQHGKKRTRE